MDNLYYSLPVKLEENGGQADLWKFSLQGEMPHVTRASKIIRKMPGYVGSIGVFFPDTNSGRVDVQVQGTRAWRAILGQLGPHFVLIPLPH